jgi:hypothetical protein
LCAVVTEMILYKLIDSDHSEYNACKQRLQRCLQEIENADEYNEFCELQGFVNNYLLSIPKIDKIINDINLELKWNKSALSTVTSNDTCDTRDKEECQFLFKKHENVINDNDIGHQGIKYIKIDEDTMVKACDIIKMVTQEELKALLMEKGFNVKFDYTNDNSNTPNRNNNVNVKGINTRFTNVISTIPYYNVSNNNNSSAANSTVKRDNILISSLKKSLDTCSTPYKQAVPMKTNVNGDISEENRKYIDTHFYSRYDDISDTECSVDDVLAVKTPNRRNALFAFSEGKNDLYTKRNLLYLFNQMHYN